VVAEIQPFLPLQLPLRWSGISKPVVVKVFRIALISVQTLIRLHVSVTLLCLPVLRRERSARSCGTGSLTLALLLTLLVSRRVLEETVAQEVRRLLLHLRRHLLHLRLQPRALLPQQQHLPRPLLPVRVPMVSINNAVGDTLEGTLAVPQALHVLELTPRIHSVCPKV